MKTGWWLYIRLLWVWLLVGAAMPVQAGSFTVVIDAGHGGKDPGARGARINEKAINLAVALKLGGLIEQRSEGVKVIYTRKTDRFIDLCFIEFAEHRDIVAHGAVEDKDVLLHDGDKVIERFCANVMQLRAVVEDVAAVVAAACHQKIEHG